MSNFVALLTIALIATTIAEQGEAGSVKPPSMLDLNLQDGIKFYENEDEEMIDWKNVKEDIWHSFESDQYEQALEQIDAILANRKVLDPVKTPRAYYSMQLNRAMSLMALNRPVEGLVELERARVTLVNAGYGSRKDINDVKEALTHCLLGLEWYEVFGISENATQIYLKRAYERLLLALHPDKNMQLDKEGRENVERLRKRITRFYEMCEEYLEQRDES